MITVNYPNIGSDYIVNSMAAYKNLFNTPVDVIEHMLCVNGNGVDASTFGPKKVVVLENRMISIGGAALNADLVSAFKATPLRSLHGWSNKEEYQPFREFVDIEIPEHYEGMRECVRYFLKCLEVTTEEDLSDPEYPAESEYYVKALKDWKSNTHILKELFDV